MKRLFAGVIAMAAINLVVPSHTLEKTELEAPIVQEETMESELLKLEDSFDRLINKLDSIK